MKLQNLALATMISLTASLASAQYYLDAQTRMLVKQVEAPKDRTAPTPDTIWVRHYRAEEIEYANLGTKVPAVARQEKDLIKAINYKGTESGHKIKIVDPTTGKLTQATVVAFFADGTVRAEFVYHESYIRHEMYDLPISAIQDRQVAELNGVKKDQKLCAINADKKIKAGQKLEVDGVWASGIADVNKGNLSELTYAFNLSSQKQTAVTNLQACE